MAFSARTARKTPFVLGAAGPGHHRASPRLYRLDRRSRARGPTSPPHENHQKNGAFKKLEEHPHILDSVCCSGRFLKHVSVRSHSRQPSRR
jgi:hypothetical protein